MKIVTCCIRCVLKFSSGFCAAVAGPPGRLDIQSSMQRDDLGKSVP